MIFETGTGNSPTSILSKPYPDQNLLPKKKHVRSVVSYPNPPSPNPIKVVTSMLIFSLLLDRLTTLQNQGSEFDIVIKDCLCFDVTKNPVVSYLRQCRP